MKRATTHTILPLIGKKKPLFLFLVAMMIPADANNSPMKASRIAERPSQGTQQHRQDMIPNANAAIPNRLTRRLLSTGAWETVLGEGGLPVTGGPGNGVWGTYNVVSSPQCGHGIASPAELASNSM
jgi:hypothetical protein